jgi:hypothetical protein
MRVLDGPVAGVANQVLDAVKQEWFYVIPAQERALQNALIRMDDIKERRNPGVAFPGQEIGRPPTGCPANASAGSRLRPPFPRANQLRTQNQTSQSALLSFVRRHTNREAG